MSLGCKYVLEAILATKMNKEGIYSRLKSSLVVKASFEVVRGINQLTSSCWDDLSAQFAIQRQNIAYYKKYGGVYPTMEYQLEYRARINQLKELKSFILDSIDEIKSDGWKYDIGYCKFIRELRELIRIHY